MSRLFAAVWPPPSLIDQLRALERPARPGLRWTGEDQWHVTLRFFGHLEAAAEEALHGALGEAAAGTGPVEVTAGPAPRALGRGVWMLPVEGLEQLAERIEEATGDIGKPPPDRRFRGHLTLGRARRPGALDGLPAGQVADRWNVTEITLVESKLDPDGARYRVAGRWRLAGGVNGRP